MCNLLNSNIVTPTYTGESYYIFFFICSIWLKSLCLVIFLNVGLLILFIIFPHRVRTYFEGSVEDSFTFFHILSCSLISLHHFPLQFQLLLFNSFVLNIVSTYVILFKLNCSMNFSYFYTHINIELCCFDLREISLFSLYLSLFL